MAWVMHLHYRLGLGELLELNRSSRVPRLKGCLVAALGIGMVFFGLWVALFRDGDLSPVYFFVAGGVFLLLGLIAPWLGGFGAWLLRRSPAVDLEVTSEGLRFLDMPGAEWVAWNQFTWWYTTRRLLVLEISWHDTLAIPKRCSEQASWVQLVEWVRAGVQKSHGVSKASGEEGGPLV